MHLAHQQLDALLCLFVGCPLNLLLIWLILFKTNKSMRIWSWLLLQTSLIDLANLLVFFIVQPKLFFNGNVVGFYSEGPFGQCHLEIIFLLSIVSIYFFELSKYAIAGQFFYRWMIICRDQKASSFLYAASIGIPMMIAFLPVFGLSIDTDFLARSPTAVNCPDCLSAEETILFYKSNTTIEYFCFGFIMIIANLTTFSIILVTSILIWRKTRQSVLPEQPHSREFSRQIGWVLFIQALVPFFLSLLPALLISVFTASKLNIPEAIPIISMRPWPSLLAPLTTILIIGKYRRTLAKLLFCKKALNGIQIAKPTNATNGLIDSNGIKIGRIFIKVNPT